MVIGDRWCVELYIFDIPNPKNLQTKKDHLSCVIRTKDKKGTFGGRATLTYRVTLWVYSDLMYLFEIHARPKNMQNKKKRSLL